MKCNSFAVNTSTSGPTDSVGKLKFLEVFISRKFPGRFFVLRKIECTDLIFPLLEVSVLSRYCPGQLRTESNGLGLGF